MTDAADSLGRAARLVQDRSGYGDPGVNLGRTARLWSEWLGHRVTASDVAGCMVLLKLSRLASDPGCEDSWLDAAAYAGLGCALRPGAGPVQAAGDGPWSRTDRALAELRDELGADR